MSVLLATCAALPDGEEGGELLLAALAARGHEARWAAWDDPGVDWAAADLVAVRSTWDYVERPGELLAWTREVEGTTSLLNGAACFEWNHDKAYLVDLDAPRVPTRALDAIADLGPLLAQWGSVVVKSRTGASGLGVVLVDAADDPRLAGLLDGPWIAQPLVDSIRTAGEISVFVLAGEPVSQVRKRPGVGEIRVHEEYGGSTLAVPLDPLAAQAALTGLDAATRHLGREPDYARVDLVHLDGRLVVSELELIEPGLYLEVLPGNAEAFADLVSRRLGG